MFTLNNFKSTTEFNFVSIGCKPNCDVKQNCKYGGKFYISDKEKDNLYKYILSNIGNIPYSICEKRSEYFKLFYDFDIDKYKKDIFVDINEFIDYLLSKIIYILKFYIVTEEKHVLDYIYSNKQSGHNFHLYFPNIVLNQYHAIAIRSTIITVHFFKMGRLSVNILFVYFFKIFLFIF